VSKSIISTGTVAFWRPASSTAMVDKATLRALALSNE
jgi:hypothetical protein